VRLTRREKDRIAADVDTSGLKNAAAGANLGSIEPFIRRISARGSTMNRVLIPDMSGTGKSALKRRRHRPLPGRAADRRPHLRHAGFAGLSGADGAIAARARFGIAVQAGDVDEGTT